MIKTRFSFTAAATLVLVPRFSWRKPNPALMKAFPCRLRAMRSPPPSRRLRCLRRSHCAAPAPAAPAGAGLAPAAQSNPDAGIIETPLPPSSGRLRASPAAALQRPQFRCSDRQSRCRHRHLCSRTGQCIACRNGLQGSHAAGYRRRALPPRIHLSRGRSPRTCCAMAKSLSRSVLSCTAGWFTPPPVIG